MKKVIIFILTCLLLSSCTSSKTVTSYSTTTGITSVDYEELSQMKASQIKFILYVGRPDCGDCIEFYPILEEYINNHEGTGIYYMNIKEMRDQANAEDASEEAKQFYEDFYNEYKISWTPTIEIINNGKIEKQYQYLDEDYIEIEDREEQKEKRQEFIDEFNQFMDDYYQEVEENNK